MALLCAVVDKLTSPANEALEYMLEIAKHSYESEYRSIKDISSVNIKRIAEIEDIDINKFETSVTSNTVAIEFTKEGGGKRMLNLSREWKIIRNASCPII